MATLGSTTCQVRRCFQSRETTPTRLRMSSGSLFQSPAGAWRSLLIRTGARPLARNSSAKLVARTRSLSISGPRQNPLSRFCSWTSSSAPIAIPVVLAEEPDAGEPAGALQAVEIVELPLLAGTEILADAEVVGQPVDPRLEAAVDTPLAAVLDPFALKELLALEPPQSGDDQAGDPRAGHARGRIARVGRVGPARRRVSGSLPSRIAPVPRPRA